MNPRRVLTLLAALIFAPAVLAQFPSASWRVTPSDPVVGEDFIAIAVGSTPTLGAYVDTATLSFANGGYVLAAQLGVRSDLSMGDSVWATASTRATQAGVFPLRFTYTVGGQSRSDDFGPINVAPAVVAPTPAYRNLSGNWFVPGESGWGFNLIQNAQGQLSGVWMTYQPATDSPTPYMQQRNATRGAWYFMPSGRWVTPTFFRGLLYETTGPAVGLVFDASKVYAVPRGMATFTIASDSLLDFVADITVEGPVGTLDRRGATKRLVKLDP